MANGLRECLGFITIGKVPWFIQWSLGYREWLRYWLPLWLKLITSTKEKLFHVYFKVDILYSSLHVNRVKIAIPSYGTVSHVHLYLFQFILFLVVCDLKPRSDYSPFERYVQRNLSNGFTHQKNWLPSTQRLLKPNNLIRYAQKGCSLWSIL